LSISANDPDTIGSAPLIGQTAAGGVLISLPVNAG
jgi:hypothetical protein